MKKFRFAALILVLCLLLATVASADLIVEPKDDFYAKHAAQCTGLPRTYIANGADGYATIWKSPENSSSVRNMANGETVYGYFTYADVTGEVWSTVGENAEEVEGWIRLSDFAAKPDAITFSTVYSKDFTETYTGPEDPFRGKDLLIAWKYPGAAKEESSEVSASLFLEIERYLDTFFDTYWTDSTGRVWGHCGYAFGMRDVWFCLSDPENAEITFDDPILRQPDIVPAAEEVPERTGMSNVAIGILVVVIAAGSGFVTGRLQHRRRR